MVLGMVKRITVMADAGTDVIIITTIGIQTIRNQVSGETVVAEALLTVAVQDGIPQATRTMVVEVPAVVEEQEDILQAHPAAATQMMMMIEAHQVVAVIPAVVAHQVAAVALAAAGSRKTLEFD